MRHAFSGGGPSRRATRSPLRYHGCMQRVTPMIHVSDLTATIAWYEALGFRTLRTNADEGAIDWALLELDEGRVMFNAGGAHTNAPRREVDLYVHTSGVDALYARLKDTHDVIEGPHNTFYGMRELIVRDQDGFWVTFGEPSATAE